MRQRSGIVGRNTAGGFTQAIATVVCARMRMTAIPESFVDLTNAKSAKRHNLRELKFIGKASEFPRNTPTTIVRFKA